MNVSLVCYENAAMYILIRAKDSFDFSLSRSPITFAIIYINFVLKCSSRDLGASEKSNTSP